MGERFHYTRRDRRTFCDSVIQVGISKHQENPAMVLSLLAVAAAISLSCSGCRNKC
jgi:hypothetical protein